MSDNNNESDWFAKYQQLKGQGRRLNIPDQRPESPNDRLRAAGIQPQQQPNLNYKGTEEVNQDLQAFTGYTGFRDVNINQALAQRAMQQHQQEQQPVCRLYENVEFYRPLNLNGFMDGALRMCRMGGRVPNTWGTTEFMVRGQKQCYVVGLNETTVDIAKVQARPELLTNLVEVSSPMIGTLYVPQHALYNRGQSGRVMHDAASSHRQGNKVLLG